MIVYARAPVRLDFAGGWSDVPVFADAHGGAVTNAAFGLYARVELRLGGGSDRILLHAEDLEQRLVVNGAARLTYDGTLDLHKAALNMLPVTGGVELLTRCEVPAGSGLGASGALDVALVAALARAREETYAAADLAELGFALEAGELRLEGGRQDQYAAALGGVNALRFAAGAVEAVPVRLAADAVADFNRHLVVIYTGQSHFSSRTHRRVWDAYGANRTDVVDALHTIKDLGVEAARVLEAGDWRGLARVVEQNWSAQQRLDPTISTPAVRGVEEAARAGGAWGLKAAGAGAGGCLVAIAAPTDVPRVRAAVTAVGATVLEGALADTGVEVWVEDAEGA